MAAPSGFSPDLNNVIISVYNTEGVGVVTISPDQGFGIIEAVGINVYRFTVGQPVIFTNEGAFFTTTDAKQWSIVSQDLILVTYLSSPPS